MVAEQLDQILLMIMEINPMMLEVITIKIILNFNLFSWILIDCLQTNSNFNFIQICYSKATISLQLEFNQIQLQVNFLMIEDSIVLSQAFGLEDISTTSVTNLVVLSTQDSLLAVLFVLKLRQCI